MRKFIDAMIEVGTEFQRQDNIRKLQNDIYRLNNECGSCKHWMTSKCEREKTQLVSMGQSICNDFEMGTWTNEFLKTKEKELKKLKP